MKNKKRTLSVPGAGQVLGVGRNASYEAARVGQIPTVRIGKLLRVPIPALERLLGLGEGQFDVDEFDAGKAGGSAEEGEAEDENDEDEEARPREPKPNPKKASREC